MRAYFFTNFYLSSIQHGIQSAHCLHEMFIKYSPGSDGEGMVPGPSHQLYDWANFHKTMIVLNGGNSQSLADLYSKLLPLSKKLYLPIAKFSEDEISLNNALTSVGIILPENIWNHDLEEELRTIEYGILADVGQIPLSAAGEIKTILSSYRLAH